MVEVTERLHATPPAPAALSRHTWVGWLLPVGVPTALVALHMQLYGRWIVDDAAITFAYARSLAAGEGAVLQPDADPVEGYSNPAWLAVLVLGRWLGLFDHGTWFGVPDLVVFPKFVALLCCAGVFAAFYAVARAVSQRPVLLTVVAGAAAAAVPSFVIWVSSGLETRCSPWPRWPSQHCWPGPRSPDGCSRCGSRSGAGCWPRWQRSPAPTG
jgi:hypothetical protein